MENDSLYDVILKCCSDKLKEEDIYEELNCFFPDCQTFYNFYIMYNGGYANKNFVRHPSGFFECRYFFSMKKSFSAELGTIKLETEKTKNRYKNIKHRYDSKWSDFFDNKIIFSEDSGGNPISIDIENGGIIYTPLDDDMFSFEILGFNFSNFLENLEYQSVALHEMDSDMKVEDNKDYEDWWDSLPT